MEKFHLFWKKFRTRSISGHVSGQLSGHSLLLDKTWNISRQYGNFFIYSGKVYGKKYISKKFFGPKIYRKKFVSGQNLDFYQIVQKILICSDKVSGQNFFPDKLFNKFPEFFFEKDSSQSEKDFKLNLFLDKFPNLICFRTKSRNFPDILENFIYTGKVSKHQDFFSYNK